MIPAPVDTNWFDPNLDLPPDQLLSKLEGKFVIERWQILASEGC